MSETKRIVFSDIDGTIMHEPKEIDRVSWERAGQGPASGFHPQVASRGSHVPLTQDPAFDFMAGCCNLADPAIGERSTGESSLGINSCNIARRLAVHNNFTCIQTRTAAQ